jgi:hypothetical protein
MKPGPRDHQHRLKIAGDELQELKRLTAAMCESFGLGRKIEKYQGTPCPITLYCWDLDCLLYPYYPPKRFDEALPSR